MRLTATAALVLALTLAGCSGYCDPSGCTATSERVSGKSLASGARPHIGALILMSATHSHSGTR